MGSTARKTGEMTSMPIRIVHVIFKTHLDLGFTDSAANVKQAYMTRFIPQALSLGREMRAAGGLDVSFGPPAPGWCMSSWNRPPASCGGRWRRALRWATSSGIRCRSRRTPR